MMPIIHEDEIWKKLRSEYNVSSDFEAMIEIEKKFPGIFSKGFQTALNPKILYQYTTIQALTMILSTKRLKLNSLKNVDDKVEVLAPGENDHFAPIEKHQFQPNKKSHCHNS